MPGATTGARTVALLAMLGAALAVVAAHGPAPDQFSFGARKLTVPAPDGYVAKSAASPQLVQMLQAYQPASNRLVEVYVEPGNFAALEAGETPGLDPYFHLAVLRAAEGKVLSSADFTRQTANMESELAAAMGEVSDKVQEQVVAGNAEFKDKTGVDIALKISPPKFLGAHRREPWGMFFSIRSTVTVPDDQGQAQVQPMVASVAVLLINHQLMYLNAYRNDSRGEALQWTRAALDRWADAVHAANPDDPALEAQSKKFGVDWYKIGQAGARGALLGALIVLVLWGIKKFRKA